MHIPSASDAPSQAEDRRPSDIPEEDSELMILSDENGVLPTPPAHIAARFGRYSSARRRTSAASSRRNSLSSQQSHQSSLSYERRHSYHSNHVAQHLRRASIIETRKARLADRAAYAEQVRLRAALAKNAPRVSNSEEKALAAQAAREKLLAQVAATCAEEVRRAKEKARATKELREAEERRVRQEMEDKLAEVERRRLEYKRNGRRLRTTSISPDRKTGKEDMAEILDEETAARRLQNAWRTVQRKRQAEVFSNANITIDRVQQSTFEDFGSLMSEETVVSATEKVLGIFGLLSGDRLQDKATTRTFLSAYLILGHPAAVLSGTGDQEQDLIKRAKDLLVCFESIFSKLSASNRFMPSPTQLGEINQVHATYMTAFTAWKAQDASTIIETLVATFVELDAIWQTVKDATDGEVANDYKQGIRDNQVIILSKLRKLAGPDRANSLIKKAIRESRRAKARKRPSAAEARPRVAGEVENGQSSGSASGPTAASHEAASQLSAAASSPGARQQLNEFNEFMRLFSPIPSNRILVHELSVDKDFRIDASPHSSLRDAVNQAVCHSMRIGVQQGQADKWTVAMAETVRGKLLRLLRPGNSLHTLISEALDPEHVQRQCREGVFSYDKFFSFMASILPKLCAPFRDTEVKALSEELQDATNDTDAMIDKLFKLLHMIDLFSLDYSNFLLTNAAPVLLREAAGYERRAFADDLASGAITLQRTRNWWTNASVNVLTEAERRDPEGINHPASRPTAQSIYKRGLVDLAISTAPLQEAEVPETLHLDKLRLARMRADALRITTVGAILLTAKNLLKRDVRSQWKTEAARMWEALKEGYLIPDAAPDTPSKVLSIIESSHALPPSTKTTLSNTVTRFLTQAHNASSTDTSSPHRLTDPVMKVLFQRMKSHILARLSASSTSERVRAASTASESLASLGLPEFSTQVGGMVELLGRMSDIDWKAHGQWYDQISSELESRGDTAQI